jgi:hypothetical protein
VAARRMREGARWLRVAAADWRGWVHGQRGLARNGSVVEAARGLLGVWAGLLGALMLFLAQHPY